MNTQSLLAVFCLLFFVSFINSQKSLQEQNGEIIVPPTPIQIDQIKSQVIIEDPFAKRTSPEHGKRHHPRSDNGQIPQDAEQDWQIYKPFVYDDEDEEKQEPKRSKVNTKEFNEFLKWSLLAGTGFLAYVLVRTCTKKRGRREMRRVMEEAQRRRQNIAHPTQNVYFYQPYPQPVFNPIQKQPQEVLDDKIHNAEMELARLKELKQQNMKQEFNRKKMEEEQRKRIEMVNVQRAQQFQLRQNNFNVGYGPVFYGQQNLPQAQQPFHIQGIEPIRKRSNSFKTEISEQPILNNQIKYRNGIPIGKPIRQNDNDSSFASEYPEV